MTFAFLEGVVRYPDDLPCPQVDTDLVPRERRYISDITDVRNMRMFQQEFQATRNRISFIFTEEEAREFREWYEHEIIYGGAWFYADWPILHKDKQITYRFVGQPKYEWLLGANPGALGRSKAGYNTDRGVVPLYKVTATVELYENRKVGKFANVYTSKIYPLYFKDAITTRGVTVKGLPYATAQDSITLSGNFITSGTLEKYIFSSYQFKESITLSGQVITAGTTGSFIYSSYTMADESIMLSGVTVLSGEIERARYLEYDYFDDSISLQGVTITSGEIE